MNQTIALVVLVSAACLMSIYLCWRLAKGNPCRFRDNVFVFGPKGSCTNDTVSAAAYHSLPTRSTPLGQVPHAYGGHEPAVFKTHRQ